MTNHPEIARVRKRDAAPAGGPRPQAPCPSTGAAPRFRALDLFCGAGGASRGLQRAGFHVTGIDIRPQPRYVGDLFIQADALNPPVRLEDFDFIWASPPCQAHTLSNNRDARGKHLDLIPETRELLERSGRVWCIENVPMAPIHADLVLDGTMFPELRVIRRRHFEMSFPAPILLGFPAHNLVGRHGWSTCTDGDTSSHSRASRRRHGLPIRDTIADRRAAMGVTWPMNRAELGNAIPPAYSEFIGCAALRHLDARSAA